MENNENQVTEEQVAEEIENTGNQVAEEQVAEKKTKKKKVKLTKLEKWFRTMRRFHRFFMKPFFPYKKHGHVENFNDGPYIIVGNHLSVLDVLLAAVATDKPIHYMAKKELCVKGISKWFTTKCEAIPVNRDGNDVRAIMQSMKYLKEGGIVCIFPEGTRNKTKELFLPFRSGATALSIKTHTPIIPMVQVTKIKAFRKQHVLYGEPFEFTEYYDKKLTPEDIAVCDEILRQKLEDMYYELKEMLDSKKKKNKK